MKKNNKGFSLVELIVVIAIMAILAAVAVTSFAIYIDNAQERADLNYLENILYFAELYSIEYQIPLEGLVIDPVVESGDNIKLIIGYNADESYIYYNPEDEENDDIGNPDISEMIFLAVGPGYVEGGFDNGKYKPDQPGQPGEDDDNLKEPNPGLSSCRHEEYEVLHTEPAICMQAPWEQRECKNPDCKAVWTVDIGPVKAHNFEELKTVGKYTYYTCNDCGRIQIKSSDGSVIVPIN